MRSGGASRHAHVHTETTRDVGSLYMTIKCFDITVAMVVCKSTCDTAGGSDAAGAFTHLN